MQTEQLVSGSVQAANATDWLENVWNGYVLIHFFDAVNMGTLVPGSFEYIWYSSTRTRWICKDKWKKTNQIAKMQMSDQVREWNDQISLQLTFRDMKSFFGLFTVAGFYWSFDQEQRTLKGEIFNKHLEVVSVSPSTGSHHNIATAWDELKRRWWPNRTKPQIENSNSAQWTQEPGCRNPGAVILWAVTLNDKVDDKYEIKEIEDYPEHPDKTAVLIDAFIRDEDLITMIVNETGRLKTALVMESFGAPWKTLECPRWYSNDRCVYNLNGIHGIPWITFNCLHISEETYRSSDFYSNN